MRLSRRTLVVCALVALVAIVGVSASSRHHHEGRSGNGGQRGEHNGAAAGGLHAAGRHHGQHHAPAATVRPTIDTSDVSVHATCIERGQKLEKLSNEAVQARMASSAAASAGASTLTISPSQTFQTLVGFGGAITNSSVTVIQQLPAAVQQQIIDAYYGANGNRYSTGRMHINSCDFSVASYNFDNVTDDFALEFFDKELTHDQSFMIPFVQKVLAQSYHPVQLFATPWSPPAWMKANGAMDWSEQPGLKADPRYHDAWARYLSMWISAMENNNIPFWGMTVQNEPENPAAWEACVFTAAQERDFIKGFLGPTFRADHPDLKLIAYDHNKDHVVEWADTIFGDADASQYVWGIAVHWYSGDQFDNLNTTNANWPAKPIFATEATNAGPVPGSVPAAERYAHDILGDLNNWVVGWTDWNIVLDTQGGPNHLENWCDSPMIADVTTGTLAIQPMYWYLGHFSRFLPPGSVRVANTLVSSDPAVLALEFATFLGSPDNAGGKDVVVLVVMNAQNSTASFQLALEGQTTPPMIVVMDPHSIQTITLPQLN